MSKPANAVYDWDEALAHLELLGHRGVGVTKISAFRAKPPEPLRYIGVFEPAHYQFAVAQMRELNRNHPTLSYFLGFNPLYESALQYAPNKFIPNNTQPKKEDVISVVNIVLDIDPVSERDKTTEEERQALWTVAEDLLDEPLLAGASLIDSGHGAYVIARLPVGTYDWEAVKAFCEDLKLRYFSQPDLARKVKLDVPGPSQLIGLAGTVNTKLDQAIWAPRRILRRGGICHALAEHLRAWKPPVPQGPAEKIELGNLGPVDDRIADWCPGYQQLLHTKPALGKRSDAAFALALKMDRDGWPWADIESTVRTWGKMVFSDEHDTHRLDRILDGLQDKLHDPAYAKVLPSHKFLRDILGSCPCAGNCDVDLAIQRNRQTKLIEVDWEHPIRRDGEFLTTVGLNLDGARRDLRHYYNVHLTRTLGDSSIIFQSAGAPGIGKTYLMLRRCAFIPVTVFTTRREEFGKIKADLQADLSPEEIADAERMADLAGMEQPYRRPDVVIIDPRELACEEPACQAAIQELKTTGHPGFAESRVCKHCPRYANRLANCRYYRQFNLPPNTTVIAATAWLHLRQLPQLIQHAKIVIFDEDPLDHAFEQISTTHHQLQNAITFVQNRLPEYVGQFEPILEALARASRLETLSAFKNDPVATLARSINLPIFNRRYRQITEDSPADQLPPLPLTYILAALRQKPGKMTQMLVVGKNELRWRRLRRFNPPVPVAILDATGAARLYEPIFPGRKIEVDEANVQMVAHVWQISDQRLPRSSLSTSKIDQVRAIIMALYNDRVRLGPDGFAVIGRQDIVAALNLPPQIKSGHYWGVRGSRAFEDCHTLVLVGTAEPDFVDVGLQADFLFGRELPRNRIEQTRPYYLTSTPGKSWAATVDVYEDFDLQAFYERAREGEMTQAAFRIRPLEGPDKLILMLSNLPLDGLPPTELMTMDDLEARLGIKEPPATQRLLLAQKRLRRQLGKEPTHQQIANELGVSRESVGRTMRSLIIKPR